MVAVARVARTFVPFALVALAWAPAHAQDASAEAQPVASTSSTLLMNGLVASRPIR